eukprot:gene23186-28846_t
MVWVHGLLCLLTYLVCANAWDNGVAKTPPRGFSTWNAFPVHSIDEATCYNYMNAMVAKGLNEKNYTYFIVDEPCFAGRAADGTLLENKTTWPTGLKKFGEALRSHGMKLGTYTCVGRAAQDVFVDAIAT